jgi:DNA-binding NarL/FixJ family response regulator
MRGRVMIVEDDYLTAVSLSSVLDLVGFEVVATTSRVRDALTQARRTSPQLAIFGVGLAGNRDGIEGASLLREFMDIPVLLVTARADAQTRARAKMARPAAILQKPVPSSVIISAVQKAMPESEPDQLSSSLRRLKNPARQPILRGAPR